MAKSWYELLASDGGLRIGRGTPRGRQCVMTTDELWAEVLKFRRRLLSAARVPRSVVRRGTEGNGLVNQAFGAVSRLPTRRMMSRATAVGEPT